MITSETRNAVTVIKASKLKMCSRNILLVSMKVLNTFVPFVVDLTIEDQTCLFMSKLGITKIPKNMYVTNVEKALILPSLSRNTWAVFIWV